MSILIVDDHAMFREAIARVLSIQSDFDVSHCGTPAEALRMLGESSYDLVLLDLDLGEEVATRLIPQIRQAGYSGRIVILSAFVSEHATWKLAESGVDGIVLKVHSTEVLLERIRAALRGEPCSDPVFATAMADINERGRVSPWPDLSPRERDTLRGLIRGKGNKEIATDFNVSEHAVKATLQRLFNKTGARTRSELVRIALQNYSDEL